MLDVAIHPQNQTVHEGETVTFSLAVGNSSPLNFQWKKNGTALTDGGNISGATSASLVLTNVGLSDMASYTLTATNSVGSVITEPAVLYVFGPAANDSPDFVLDLRFPPQITSQPQSQTNFFGTTVIFSATVTGNPTLMFQWRKNNAPISDGGNVSGGATASLTLNHLSKADEATYTIMVTNNYGSVTSAPATLTIAPSGSALDTNKPTLSITSPTNNAAVTNFITTIKGAARDTNGTPNTGVALVLYSLNDGPLQPAGTTNQYANWSATVTLNPGSNTFAAQSLDYRGNVSALHTNNYFLKVVQPLTVITNGHGKTSMANGTNLVLTKVYTNRATASANYVFSNWLASANGGPTVVVTNVTNCIFVMQSNLVLTANFVTNPITANHAFGKYNGLFNTSPMDLRSAGFVGNLVVASNGTYSCTVTVQGKTYPTILNTYLTGKFDNNGDSTLLIKRTATIPVRSNLVATLHLDWVNGTKQITGTVTNTDLADPWSATLLLDQAAGSATAGRYTSVIAPAVSGPQGDGYGAISNSSSGMFNLIGKVADGSGISQVVPISKDGNVPLYVKLYNSQGLLAGMLNFTNGAMTGSATWIKPGGLTNVGTYPEGFTNTVALSGDTYTKPVSPARVLAETNLVLTVHDSEGFSTNNAGGDLLWNVQLRATNLVVVAGSATNKLSVAAINPADGTLNIAYQTTGGPNKTLAGIVDQVKTNGAGYLIGTTNVGSFSLHPWGVPVPSLPAVWIQPGTFTMGSPDNEQDRNSDEGPQTVVTLTTGFFMSKYLVRQGDYLAVMGSNPSHYTGDANRPVETVSWVNATNYCAQLNAQEQTAGRLPAGWVYRLPTEAEWEYACRAGTTTRFSFGDDPSSTLLGSYAWYSSNSGGTTQPVGTKLPNPWGLYDMHGNVFEWCQDWFGTYPGGSVTNPSGPASSSDRVIRGGDWSDDGANCRSANRYGNFPSSTGTFLGFRVVLAPGQ